MFTQPLSCHFVRTAVALLLGFFLAGAVHAADRPNILWITCEDMSCNLGCYGDGDADSPHLDALAAEGGALRQRL